MPNHHRPDPIPANHTDTQCDVNVMVSPLSGATVSGGVR